MCVDVDDLPVAHVVDLARRTPLTRDELQYVVAETMHAVAEQLADDLCPPGADWHAVRLARRGSTATVRASSTHRRRDRRASARQ